MPSPEAPPCSPTSPDNLSRSRKLALRMGCLDDRSKILNRRGYLAQLCKLSGIDIQQPWRVHKRQFDQTIRPVLDRIILELHARYGWDTKLVLDVMQDLCNTRHANSKKMRSRKQAQGGTQDAGCRVMERPKEIDPLKMMERDPPFAGDPSTPNRAVLSDIAVDYLDGNSGSSGHAPVPTLKDSPQRPLPVTPSAGFDGRLVRIVSPDDRILRVDRSDTFDAFLNIVQACVGKGGQNSLVYSFDHLEWHTLDCRGDYESLLQDLETRSTSYVAVEAR